MSAISLLASLEQTFIVIFRQARLSTFEEDLQLEGNDFNSAVSILTAG